MTGIWWRRTHNSLVERKKGSKHSRVVETEEEEDEGEEFKGGNVIFTSEGIAPLPPSPKDLFTHVFPKGDDDIILANDSS